MPHHSSVHDIFAERLLNASLCAKEIDDDGAGVGGAAAPGADGA